VGAVKKLAAKSARNAGILLLKLFGKLVDLQEKRNARAEWESHFRNIGSRGDRDPY
jgi:hypothetical protein